MGWKMVVGTVSVLVAAAGGWWWEASASAASPAPVIGPAVVVTPATPVVPEPSSVSLPATGTGGGESPEVVGPRWVRPLDDDDGHQGSEANRD